MIGLAVKIILMIQAGIGVFAGILIMASPTIFDSTGLNTDFAGIFYIGLFIAIFEGFLLVGLSKLHEK